MSEGRKWGIHIALASQLLDDFDKDMVDMATGIWIMGVGTDRAAKEAQAIFGLSATATEIVRRDLRGPGHAGAPFLAVLALYEGKHEHRSGTRHVGKEGVWTVRSCGARYNSNNNRR